MIRELRTETEILWNRWFDNAERTPDRDAIIHWSSGEKPFRWTYSSLIDAAECMAAAIDQEEIRKGDVCAIVMHHNRWLYPLYLAISCIGAIPAILAFPNPRLHPEKFRQGITGMSQRSGLDWILTERDLEPVLLPLFQNRESTIKGLRFPLEWEKNKRLEGRQLSEVIETHRNTQSSDPVLLQHSSGTTGLQKPVMLSHQAVLRHVKLYGEAIALNQQDKVVSWLPLYHDMGLIAAFHLPLAFGIPVVQLDAFEWVLAPSLLLKVLSDERGTISWLPNFAYNMIADKIRNEELDGINLESCRLVINCSEPVRHESNKKVLERLEQYGLRSEALSSCYAMAETTFAATQTPPKRAPTAIAVDRDKLARGRVAIGLAGKNTRMCVSSGLTIPGCRIRIVDEKRRDVAPSIVGEIAIQSVSMFEGYRNYPEKTSEVLQDGWYYSGDLGFRYGEELYVIGRRKDLIIIAGNNIYPEDVEDVVGTVENVIPGRVVAFGEEDPEVGSERLCVIVETSIADEAEKRRLKIKILKAGMAIDVSISKVHLVPPRWLIKSSAGKPSRKANKERILEQQSALMEGEWSRKS